MTYRDLLAMVRTQGTPMDRALVLTYERWWNEVVQRLVQPAAIRFEDILWYQMPDEFNCPRRSYGLSTKCVGFWGFTGDQHVILVARPWRESMQAVKHEMLHAALNSDAHTHPAFKHRDFLVRSP